MSKGRVTVRNCNYCDAEYEARVAKLNAGVGLFCSNTCACSSRVGPLSSQWKEDGPLSLFAQHERVRTARGRVQDYECFCGSQADDWANLTGDYGDVGDFAPMCRSCHRRFDFAKAFFENPSARAKKLTEDQVREIRSRYAGGGVTYKSLGMEYGVTKTAIGSLIRGEVWNWVAA